MPGQLKIDVSLVAKINVTLKRTNGYKWIEATSAKTAFWPWNRKKAYPEGFYWNGRQGSDYITMDSAKKEYIVEEDGSEFKVYEKPYVYITLKHTDNVNQKCESDEEAIKWADELAAKTDKTFQTITY